MTSQVPLRGGGGQWRQHPDSGGGARRPTRPPAELLSLRPVKAGSVPNTSGPHRPDQTRQTRNVGAASRPSSGGAQGGRSPRRETLTLRQRRHIGPAAAASRPESISTSPHTHTHTRLSVAEEPSQTSGQPPAVLSANRVQAALTAANQTAAAAVSDQPDGSGCR